MASNYSSDPNNAASLSKPATPQSGPGANAPSTPHSEGGSREHSSNGRRLQPGIELSFGRYKIERSVASGGMGAVYLAIDQRFNRPCAVKEMLDDFQNETERTQAIEWFRRENSSLATCYACVSEKSSPRMRGCSKAIRSRSINRR